MCNVWKQNPWTICRAEILLYPHSRLTSTIHHTSGICQTCRSSNDLILLHERGTEPYLVTTKIEGLIIRCFRQSCAQRVQDPVVPCRHSKARQEALLLWLRGLEINGCIKRVNPVNQHYRRHSSLDRVWRGATVELAD
jgi:hypothetical protein